MTLRLFIYLIVFCFCSSSWADIYVWEDESGKKHFTDRKHGGKNLERHDLGVTNSIPETSKSSRVQPIYDDRSLKVRGYASGDIPRYLCDPLVQDNCRMDFSLLVGVIEDIKLLKPRLSSSAYKVMSGYYNNGTSIWEVNACLNEWKNGQGCSKNIHYVALNTYYPVYFAISNTQDSILQFK